MNWFRVDADVIDHPKTFALEAELDDPKAGWYLIRIWAWLTRYAQHGEIEPGRVDHLESAAKWRGEPGKLVSALVKTGWLDEHKNGAFSAHDWGEKQGKMFERADRDRERKRLFRKTARAVPQDVRRTGAGTAQERRNEKKDVTNVRTDEQNNTVELSEPADLPKPDTALDVFDYWRVKMASPRAKLDETRRGLIEARIVEGATAQELRLAIDGCAKSAWHQGENDRRRKFNGIELICRNRGKLEEFMAMADGPAGARPGEAGYYTAEESSGPLRGEEVPWENL